MVKDKWRYHLNKVPWWKNLHPGMRCLNYLWAICSETSQGKFLIFCMILEDNMNHLELVDSCEKILYSIRFVCYFYQGTLEQGFFMVIMRGLMKIKVPFWYWILWRYQCNKAFLWQFICIGPTILKNSKPLMELIDATIEFFASTN